MFESDNQMKDSNSIVLHSKNWHQGVIGIIASRIAERYSKPTFLIAVDEDGIGKGSGRSVNGINIYKALLECQKVFENFGGHEQAAGITIKEKNIPLFEKMLEKTLDKSKDENIKNINIGIYSFINII